MTRDAVPTTAEVVICGAGIAGVAAVRLSAGCLRLGARGGVEVRLQATLAHRPARDGVEPPTMTGRGAHRCKLTGEPDPSL